MNIDSSTRLLDFPSISSSTDPMGHFTPLPLDVVFTILQYLKSDLPSVALVCKEWRALADNALFREKIRPTKAFGRHEWKEYMGVDVDFEPALPRRVYKDMETDAYLLTLVPELIKMENEAYSQRYNTLHCIDNVLFHSKKGCKIYFSAEPFDSRIINQSNKIEKSHWVLLKKFPMGSSRRYFKQVELVKEENKKVPGARISNLIDIVTSVVMEYVKTGNLVFNYHPKFKIGKTWVRIKKKCPYTDQRLGVGFAVSGIEVDARHASRDDFYVVVVPSWKYFGTNES